MVPCRVRCHHLPRKFGRSLPWTNIVETPRKNRIRYFADRHTRRQSFPLERGTDPDSLRFFRCLQSSSVRVVALSDRSSSAGSPSFTVGADKTFDCKNFARAVPERTSRRTLPGTIKFQQSGTQNHAASRLSRPAQCRRVTEARAGSGAEHPRFGYRCLHVLQGREHVDVNPKIVHRVSRERGITVEAIGASVLNAHCSRVRLTAPS